MGIRVKLSPYAIYAREKLVLGDYVNYKFGGETVYRVMSLMTKRSTRGAICIAPYIEAGAQLTKDESAFQTEWLEVKREEVTLVEKSALRFFSPWAEHGRNLYHKGLKEEGWRARMVKPSVYGYLHDRILCSGPNHDKLHDLSIQEVIPIRTDHCYRCYTPLHYKFNRDCPRCRWFICPDSNCQACGCEGLNHLN
ncbi:MAG: hypothetical protein ABGX20_18820 [Bacillus sp. (in: firmicutes)]